MIKRRILNATLALSGLFFSVHSAAAQDKPPQTQVSNQTLAGAAPGSSQPAVLQEDEEKFFDDDGGRVFIVRREDQGLLAVDKLKHYGGKVITEPQTYNIFLGQEWTRKKQLQSRQHSFDNLLAASGDRHERAWLDGIGAPGFSISSLNYQEPYDFGKDNLISDLQVRALLGEMLKQGTLPESREQNIYLVFLPPGVRSTLGQMRSGKHYLAYHNFFEAESNRVNYVVVPFEPDAWQMMRSAHLAVVQTIINSDGNGWH